MWALMSHKWYALNMSDLIKFTVTTGKMSYWKALLSHAHLNVPGFKIGIERLSDEIRPQASYQSTNEIFITGHVLLNNVIQTEKNKAASVIVKRTSWPPFQPVRTLKPYQKSPRCLRPPVYDTVEDIALGTASCPPYSSQALHRDSWQFWGRLDLVQWRTSWAVAAQVEAPSQRQFARYGWSSHKFAATEELLVVPQSSSRHLLQNINKIHRCQEACFIPGTNDFISKHRVSANFNCI